MAKQKVESKTWKLSDWCRSFSPKIDNRPDMTNEEIETAIKFLRDNYYPKPTDCSMEYCKEFRPACKLGICKIAVLMSGDW